MHEEGCRPRGSLSPFTVSATSFFASPLPVAMYEHSKDQQGRRWFSAGSFPGPARGAEIAG